MRFRWWLSLVAVMAMLAFTTLVAGAHEPREVGSYELVVGFMVEPAVEGVQNGVDLRVRIPAETEGGEPTPVEGLEETLQVEITHVASGVSKTTGLRTIFRDPGHYTADLIPTAPGQYRFRFFGSIEGLEIDETFESGPGRFGDVQSSAELQFPQQLPTMREVEGAVRGAQGSAQQAQDSASAANSLAIAGVVLGAVGAVSGVAALVMARKRQ